MPAVVPHLESADPTEAMLVMMMLLLMMMKMTLLLIIPPSRDKTLHLAEPRGKEWKGKERNVIKLFLRALQMIINHFGIKIPCGVLSLICCCCYTHTCARACVCEEVCEFWTKIYHIVFDAVVVINKLRRYLA